MNNLSEKQVKVIVVVDPNITDYLPLVSDGKSRSQSFCFFTTGADALRWSRAGQAQLWMVNFQLPDMTGLELCELLRGRLIQTPVLVVSNSYDSDSERSVLETGWLHYVCKPLENTWLKYLLQEPQAIAQNDPGLGPVNKRTDIGADVPCKPVSQQPFFKEHI